MVLMKKALGRKSLSINWRTNRNRRNLCLISFFFLKIDESFSCLASLFSKKARGK
jgi:hypothetical protein